MAPRWGGGWFWSLKKSLCVWNYSVCTEIPCNSIMKTKIFMRFATLCSIILSVYCYILITVLLPQRTMPQTQGYGNHWTMIRAIQRKLTWHIHAASPETRLVEPDPWRMCSVHNSAPPKASITTPCKVASGSIRDIPSRLNRQSTDQISKTWETLVETVVRDGFRVAAIRIVHLCIDFNGDSVCNCSHTGRAFRLNQTPLSTAVDLRFRSWTNNRKRIPPASGLWISRETLALDAFIL